MLLQFKYRFIQEFRKDQRPGRIQHRVLHDALELSNVARPRVPLKSFERFRGEATQLHVEFAIKSEEEVVGEFRDVFESLSQRGHAQGDGVQPKEEILAKLSCRDQTWQILIRGRQHANLCLDRLIAAEPAS